MKFTFKTKGNTLIEIQGLIKEDEMIVNVYGTEDDYGNSILFKQESK